MITLLYLLGSFITMLLYWVWDQWDRMQPGEKRAVYVHELLVAGAIWPLWGSVVLLLYGKDWLEAFLEKQILFKNKVK